MSLPPDLAERIEDWAAEFPQSDAARGLPESAQARSSGILASFLKAACERAGGAVEDIERKHLSQAFLEDLPKLEIAEDVRPHVAPMARAFLERLEVEGRLAGGRVHGAAIEAAAPAYLKAAGGKTEPIRNASAKPGRNDPCPCGSGKKHKKCCLK